MDEFYTLYKDVKFEPDQFKDKIIYCSLHTKDTVVDGHAIYARLIIRRKR